MKLTGFSSYEEYVRIQTLINKAKIHDVWACDKELRTVARLIRRINPQARFGLCHGVRNGYEVQKFRELLGFEVIGTEISETATQFPHVIQWDFHEVQPSWLGAVDMIYSNSWDHSFDPSHMLRQWLSCLSPQGRLVLQWTRQHDEEGTVGTQGADCFGASLQELLDLVAREGGVVDQVLTLRARAAPNTQRWFKRLRRTLWPRFRKISLVVVRRGD
ncbi:MAG: class I SAM-dependent methyltransferase [Magnetococcus sp. WYHC-3]